MRVVLEDDFRAKVNSDPYPYFTIATKRQNIKEIIMTTVI